MDTNAHEFVFIRGSKARVSETMIRKVNENEVLVASEAQPQTNKARCIEELISRSRNEPK